MSPRHVVIDVKNIALFSGGIAAWLRPLLAAWLAHRPDVLFSLVGPPFDHRELMPATNWRHISVPWPAAMPRPLRHPVYDNVLFPQTVARLQPDLIFSPYHDVRLPRAAPGRRSVMMIHDTCLAELGAIYPWRVRAYYLAMLRVNLRRAAHVITVSEASRARILALYRLAPEAVSVIHNAADQEFAAPVEPAAVQAVRARYAGARLLFYAGGSEYRKNVGRLIDALKTLVRDGRDVQLMVTGTLDDGWKRELNGRMPEGMHFLGRLDSGALKAHYAAADTVVYPTLCEGFGRLCLEAMLVGTPLACSDLPVLREVAGDYAHYFDPSDPHAMARAVLAAMDSGRRAPRRDPRFELGTVAARFTALMDRLLHDG